MLIKTETEKAIKKQNEETDLALEVFKQLKVIEDLCVPLTVSLQKDCAAMDGTSEGIDSIEKKKYIDFTKKKSELMSVIRNTGYQDTHASAKKHLQDAAKLDPLLKKVPNVPSLKKNVSKAKDKVQLVNVLVQEYQQREKKVTKQITESLSKVEQAIQKQKKASV